MRSGTQVRLSKAEHKIVGNELSNLVDPIAKERTANLTAQFKQTRKFSGLLDTELRRIGFESDRITKFMQRENLRLDRTFVAKAKMHHNSVSDTKQRRPDAVWGLTSGAALTPHDLSWTDHDTIGGNVQGNYYHFARKSDGYLYVYSHARDSNPKMVCSYAGVGFWYIPNRLGVLQVTITSEKLIQDFWNGASWNDIGSAGGWICLGIASYLANPFQFIEWRTVNRYQIFLDTSHWFGGNKLHQELKYHLHSSTIAEPGHYYACWVWLEAYAYGEDGGGFGGACLRTSIPAFTYSFI